MHKIILDTNMLMAIGQFNVDIFSEIERICNFKYELCILDRQTKELEEIRKKRGKDSRAAKLATDLIKNKKVKIIKTISEKDVDSQILEFAQKNNYIVATQDKELKNRLKRKNLQVIFLRQKKYLELR